MNESALLVDSVTRIFRDFYKNEILNDARRNGWCAALWKSLEESGMTRISLPEECGGSGGTVADAAEVLRLAGKYCASVPLAETALLAGWALAKAKLPIPSGPLSFCAIRDADRLTLKRNGDSWRISGVLENVPWARYAKALTVVCLIEDRTTVICASPSAYQVKSLANIAGEARDEVRFSDAVLDAGSVIEVGGSEYLEEAFLRGAWSRALQMCGALEQVLELTVTYTSQRSQFGRALNKFQAVQQELAKLAGEVAIAKAAAMTAASSLQSKRGMFSGVAAAKIKAGEAAQAGAAIGHQLHGAIGVTDEYVLHHSTLRLLSWRAEFGSEALWAEKLGDQTLRGGSQLFWERVTGGGYR